MRLLVVDDNEDITDMIRYYCIKGNIECEVTNNGIEALDKLRHEQFDLVLLDLAMPTFSGVDVIRTLKKDGLLESMNIAIITASPDKTILEEVKNCGIKTILRKPCSVDELTDLITKYRDS